MPGPPRRVPLPSTSDLRVLLVLREDRSPEQVWGVLTFQGCSVRHVQPKVLLLPKSNWDSRKVGVPALHVTEVTTNGDRLRSLRVGADCYMVLADRVAPCSRHQRHICSRAESSVTRGRAEDSFVQNRGAVGDTLVQNQGAIRALQIASLTGLCPQDDTSPGAGRLGRALRVHHCDSRGGTVPTASCSCWWGRLSPTARDHCLGGTGDHECQGSHRKDSASAQPCDRHIRSSARSPVTSMFLSGPQCPQQ